MCSLGNDCTEAKTTYLMAREAPGLLLHGHSPLLATARPQRGTKAQCKPMPPPDKEFKAQVPILTQQRPPDTISTAPLRWPCRVFKEHCHMGSILNFGSSRMPPSQDFIIFISSSKLSLNALTFRMAGDSCLGFPFLSPNPPLGLCYATFPLLPKPA